MTGPLDARGVEIEPGDTVIYGFGVGRSIAMAEGVVLGYDAVETRAPSVSLTPEGRVRVRIIRRSYSSGVKPIVDVAPDRLVVLKPVDGPGTTPSLPGSPLPTQAEEARKEIERLVKRYTDGLRAAEPPDYWREPPESPETWLANYHAYCARELARLRRKLKEIDDYA